MLGLGVGGMLLTWASADSGVIDTPTIDALSPESGHGSGHEAGEQKYRGTKTLVARAPRLVALAAPLGETSRERVAPTGRTTLKVYCCPTAYRGFAARIERSFEDTNRGIDLQLIQRADRDCVGHTLMGSGDVAIIATKLSDNERSRGLQARVIAHQIVVAVVHPSNQITSITHGDLQTLLSGTADTWRLLGGEDIQIQPVCKHPGRIDDQADRMLRVRDKAAAIAIYMNDPRSILGYVANQPRAFGLVNWTSARDVRDVRTLRISETAPSAKALERGVWPLGSTIRVVTRQHPDAAARAFLDYIATETAQKVLRQKFVLPTAK